MIDVQVLHDARKFYDLTHEYLLVEEAKNNMFLSTQRELLQRPELLRENAMALVATHQGQVAGALLSLDGYAAMVSSCTPEVAGHLVRHIRKAPAILGPEPIARQMALEYQELHKCQAQLGIEQEIWELSDLQAPEKPTGKFRRAWLKDMPRLTQWSREFVYRYDLPEPLEETRAKLRENIEKKWIYVWDDEDIKSMAHIGGLTPNGARISEVFTAPAYRKQGYASATVYELCRTLMHSGKRKIFLFTDTHNVQVARIYIDLGFSSIGSFNEWKFTL